MQILACIAAYVLGIITVLVFGHCKESGLNRVEKHRLRHATQDLKNHTEALSEAIKDQKEKEK